MKSPIFPENFAQQWYSTSDRELLAIYLAIKYFRHFVEGQTFYVITDHEPLTVALSSQSHNHSPWQWRHLDFIAQFTADIWYMKGSTNLAADALSRVEVDALQAPTTLDFQAMAAAQLRKSVKDNSTSSLTLQQVPFPIVMLPCSAICPQVSTLSLSSSKITFVMPFILCRILVSVLPNTWLPPGMFGLESIKTSVTGPTPVSSVNEPKCTSTQHDPLVPLPLLMPASTMYTLNLSVLFPPVKGFTYLLTCADHFTQWPEAIPFMDRYYRSHRCSCLCLQMDCPLWSAFTITMHRSGQSIQI